MNTYFRYDLNKKYIALVGYILRSIYIMKDTKTIKVPVAYSEKNKLIERYTRRAVDLKGVAMTLPRIAYWFTDFKYDGSRKLNRIYKFASEKDPSTLNVQYTPVPYNISVTTSIIANKNQDITQIVEQILPIFTPDIKFSFNLIPENDVKLDLSLCLDSNVYKNMGNESLMTDRIFISYDLHFTLKAYYFREITENKLITSATSNFYLEGYDDSVDSVTVTINDL